MKNYHTLPSLLQSFDLFLRQVGALQNTNAACNDKQCELSKDYTLEIYLPGYRKEHVKLELFPGVLQVTAQREGRATVQRQYWVPEEYNLEGTKAQMEDGVLTLRVPLREIQPSKVINID